MYRLIISSARDGIATTRWVGAVNKAVLVTSGKVRCICGGSIFQFLNYSVVK
jgi:hypothetical protein